MRSLSHNNFKSFQFCTSAENDFLALDLLLTNSAPLLIKNKIKFCAFWLSKKEKYYAPFHLLFFFVLVFQI